MADAIDALEDRLRQEVDELCPHGPEDHAEGTCETCDTAFAVDHCIADAFVDLRALLAPVSRPAPVDDDGLRAAIEAQIERIERHPVRNVQSGEVTGYMLPAHVWREIRSVLLAQHAADPEDTP